MMLVEIFYRSVEFYVVMAALAAAVLAACVRPAATGAVETRLLGGLLSPDRDSAAPSVTMICRSDGSVELLRRGVEGVGLDGAVSLCVSIKGFDITIEERLTPGHGDGRYPEPVEARFVLDFMGAERYHIRYESELTGMFAVFTLNNLPDVEITRELKR